MDGNPRRGGAARGVALVAAIVGLLSLVAVASGGEVVSGSGGVRRPGDQLLDTLLSLFIVLMAVGSVVAVIVATLIRRERMMLETVTGQRRPGALRGLASLAIGLGLAFLIARGLRSDSGPGAFENLRPPDGALKDGADDAARYDPEFAVWPVVLTCTLVIVVAVAFALNRRAHRALTPEPATVTELALADVLDETLDDLRGEQDPRLAVIASYARLERVLGAVGLPRRDAEAPEEYLDRILAAVVVSPRGARRLTDLYTWARFSGHDVRPGMKEEAIEILEQVRDELRAAEAWRDAAAPPTVAMA